MSFHYSKRLLRQALFPLRIEVLGEPIIVLSNHGTCLFLVQQFIFKAMTLTEAMNAVSGFHVFCLQLRCLESPAMPIPVLPTVQRSVFHVHLSRASLPEWEARRGRGRCATIELRGQAQCNGNASVDMWPPIVSGPISSCLMLKMLSRSGRLSLPRIYRTNSRVRCL